jgi:predicted glycosyltransferase
MVLSKNIIPDRLLPERSNLVFYFPNTKQGASPTQITLPFFENISITETKKARYQDFKLLGRSSNLYGYMGADSRVLTISFNMNLLHILEEYPGVNQANYIKFDFISNAQGPLLPKNALLNRASKLSQKFLTKTNLASALPNLNVTNQQQQAIINSVNNATNRDKVVDLMVFWSNIIRASVVNNAENPVMGPPVIRFTHGILYEDIPCICKDYSITIKDAGAYDLNTLLPLILEIKMTLEELRTGDFQKFEQGVKTKRDNLAGYEAILGDYGSMDPGPLN